MAATVALVAGSRTPTQLTYRFSYDGTAGTGISATVDNDGGVTPDLNTDCLSGQLDAVLQTAVTTQDEARALFFENPRLAVYQRKYDATLPGDISVMCAIDADVVGGKAVLVFIGATASTAPHKEDVTLEFKFAHLTTTG